MTYVLLLSPALEEDVAVVAEHYGEIAPELAERFVDQLERTATSMSGLAENCACELFCACVRLWSMSG